MILFLNGVFIAEADAGISPFDRGLTLGDGVFDTLLALDGTPQEAARHFARLIRHGNAIGITPGKSADFFMETASELLRRNRFTAGRHAVRTMVTRGPAARGLLPRPDTVPTIIMTAAPSPATPAQPVRLITASLRRNEFSPLSRIKSTNYLDNILARQEAERKGADDALLLNTAGNIACASSGNIFIAENNLLITPPLADGVMDGVTRALLIEKFSAREETITSARLKKADGIYVTSSIMGIRPVTALDGLAVGGRHGFAGLMTPGATAAGL